jgi:hypothetical protein
MLESIITIVLVLFIGVLLADFISIYLLRKVFKKNHSSSMSEEYYQLRLQIKTLQIGLIIAGVAVALYGWNIRSTLSSELKSEVLSSINLDSLKVFIDSTYSKVYTKRKNLELELVNITDVFKTIEDKSKYASKTFPYLITDIFIDLEQKSKKLFFNSLKPLNTSKLPVFSKPPFVLISGENQLSVTIGELTKDYVEIVCSGGLLLEQTPVKGRVSLWIVEKP